MDTDNADTNKQAVEHPARRPEDTVGFCLECNKLVRRNRKAQCEQGHPLQAIRGALDVAPDEEMPVLPKFHWGAFFMPPIWGAWHGVVIAGLIVLPLWLFLDSNIQSAVYRVGPETPFWTRMGVYFMTALVTICTVGLMAWFGKTGWGIAWRREYGDGTSTKTMTEFIKRERIWYWFCIPLFFALLGLAIYYWITILPETFV